MYKIVAIEVTNPARNYADVTVVAGIENMGGSSGDGDQATLAQLSFPEWIAVSGSNVYVAERGPSGSSTTTLIRVIEGIAASPDSDGDGVNDNDDAFPNNPTRAVSCAPGSFGAFSCEDAPAGTYVQDANALSALDCPVGTYNSSTGQTQCQIAVPGYFVATIAAITQTACDVGTFSSVSGSVQCEPAPIGYYVDQTTAGAATACPTNTSTATQGATSINDCQPLPSAVTDLQGIASTITAIDAGSLNLPNRIERRVTQKIRQARNTIGWATLTPTGLTEIHWLHAAMPGLFLRT